MKQTLTALLILCSLMGCTVNANTTSQQIVIHDTIKVPVNTVDTALLLSVFINGWYRGHISITQNGNSLAKDKIEFYKILNNSK